MTSDAEKTQHSTLALVLEWDDRDRFVTVVPENEDRFSIKLDRAISVLQLAGSMDAFRKQFALLMNVLGEWVFDRRNLNDIRDAYVTLT